MAINVTDAITGSLTVTDNQSGSVAQVLALSQSYAGSVSEYYSNFVAASGGGTSVTLPISPVQFLYIKNTSATIAVAIQWTKTGGSSQAILTLDPSAFIMFAENTTSNGITALTLTAASGTCTAQLVLAG